MKRTFTLISVVLLGIGVARAEFPGFSWSVGADVTSAYLWRGINLGGLAFQPDVMVGYGGLEIDGWANLSPEDYSFKAFAPELDITLAYHIFGARVGITHQHYFDGSKFFNFKGSDLPDYLADDYNTNQTEVFAEFNLGELIESVPLQIGWYTYILGDDRYVETDNNGVLGMKQAYSSYLQLSYDINFDKVGLTLTPTIGMTPWKSMYTDYEKNFAVNNVSLKLNWEFSAGDFFALDIYGIAMLNTSGITKDNIFPVVNDTYFNRHLNLALGVGIWFGND